MVLPAALREALAAATARHAARVRGWRTLPADQIHLTLRFLAAVPRESVAELFAAGDEAAAASAPFPLELAGYGAFPDAARARVLWCGCAESPPLAALAARLEQELAARGFPPERLPFRAHVTVARARAAPVRCTAWPAAVAGRVEVEGFTWFESRLSPQGPRYVSLRCTPLRGAGGAGS